MAGELSLQDYAGMDDFGSGGGFGVDRGMYSEFSGGKAGVCEPDEEFEE